MNFKTGMYICACALAVSGVRALAADSGGAITIIHEDGSIDVIDLSTKAEPVKDAPESGVVISEPAPVVPDAPAPVSVVRGDEGAAPSSAVPAKKTPVRPQAKPQQHANVSPPPPPEPRAVTPPPIPVQRGLQEGAVLTRQEALSIALDYAPPAKDMEVFQASFEGQNVYAVIFETEDGYHEILVDPASGKVLESRESAHFGAPARPGHLPQDIR